MTAANSKQMVCEIAGFPAVVTRKRVKTLRIRVGTDGILIVSAPFKIGKSEIEAFVRKNTRWIEAAREKAEKRSGGAFPNFDDDALSVFGARYPVRYVSGASDRARFVGEGVGRRIEIALKTPRDVSGAAEAVRAFYTEQLSARVSERFPYWENRMGLFAKSVTIRQMSTRHGSCTPASRAIRLALSLAEKPLECLDMVIVHELAHLRFSDHGADFYALVAEFFPEHKKYRKIANEFPSVSIRFGTGKTVEPGNR